MLRHADRDCHAKHKRECDDPAEPVESDFLRDPDGHGWHLDRARFDAWLRVSQLKIENARVERASTPRGQIAVLLHLSGVPFRIAALQAKTRQQGPGRCWRVQHSLGAQIIHGQAYR